MHSRWEDNVTADRGGIVENTHHVHAAVVDCTGKILYSIGDPHRMTLARSATKPAQALAVLETCGLRGGSFSDADLALICASHSSEPRHIERARDMLVKAEVQEADLMCGGHPPLSEVVKREWIQEGFRPSAIYNNCSGKHIGMLAGSKALTASAEGYHLPDHPVQLRVKRVVQDLCCSGEDDIKWAIDGCNLPTPACPLDGLARMYAHVGSATCQDRASAFPHGRAHALARVFRAMTTFPEMVAGEDRFCTVLMRGFEGQLIGKLGADGCYGIGIQPSPETRRLGTDTAIGIFVKIEDGDVAILYSVVAEILEQLQIGTPTMRDSISGFRHLDRRNTVDAVVGHISHNFEVRKAV